MKNIQHMDLSPNDSNQNKFINTDKKLYEKLCQLNIPFIQEENGEYKFIEDCSDFSFDGEFYCITRRKNSAIYHGSFPISQYLSIMPVGVSFSDELSKSKESNNYKYMVFKNQSELDGFLSKQGSLVFGYFSDIYSASRYVNIRGKNIPMLKKICNDKRIVEIDGLKYQIPKCGIAAYKFVKDTKLININNIYNVYKLYKMIDSLTDKHTIFLNQELLIRDSRYGKKTTEQYKDMLKKDYDNFFFFNESTKKIEHSFSNLELVTNKTFSPYQDYELVDRKTKNTVVFSRWSNAMPDYKVAVYIKVITENAYQGFTGSLFKSKTHKHSLFPKYPNEPRDFFHPETILFNPMITLQRDYDNPFDWQYKNLNNIPEDIKNYITLLKYTIVKNYKEYSGNLYDNTVWCILWSEKLAEKQIKNNLADKLISIVSLIHNFDKLKNACQEISDSKFYLCYINENEKYENRTFPRYILKSISELYNIDFNYIKLAVDVYLETKNYILPSLRRGSQIDYEIIIKSIVYHFYMNDIKLTPENIKNLLSIILIVNTASLYSRSGFSVNGVIDYGSVQQIEPFPFQNRGNNETYNIVSKNLPFIGNVSKKYKGYNTYTENSKIIENRQEMLEKTFNNSLNLFENIFNNNELKFKNNYIFGNIVESISKYEKIDNDYETLYQNIKEPSKNEYKHKDRYVGHQEPQKINNMKNNSVNHYKKFKKHDDNLSSKLSNERMKWYMFLAVVYVQKYVKKITYALTNKIKIKLPEVNTKNIKEKCSNLLFSLKPILEVYFMEYSKKQYPANFSYVPRQNHNGLNHLRSVYFSYIILTSSTFLYKNNLNNIDIFLIMYSSYFRSAGRLHEYGDSKVNPMPTSKTITFSSFLSETNKFLPNEIKQDFPPLDQFPDISNNKLSDLICVSGLLLLQGLKCMSNYIDFGKSKIVKYLFCFISTDIKQFITKFPQTTSDYLDASMIITLPHYLDHCRTTTGFSQVDSEFGMPHPDQKNYPIGRGQGWIEVFLEKYYDSHILSTKKFMFNTQKNILRKTGYSLMSDDMIEKQIPELSYSIENRCREMNAPDEKYGRLSKKFEELSDDYDKAWSVIFENVKHVSLSEEKIRNKRDENRAEIYRKNEEQAAKEKAEREKNE